VVVNPPVIDAVNDDYSGTPVNGYAGGNAGNAFSNDTLNGVVVVPAQITATITTPASNPGVTLNTANGSVDVAAGTPAGTYTIDYQICENLNPTNCDTATITVVVNPPVINAVNDDYSGTPVNGVIGGNAGNAFSNDTLNGVPVVPAQITTTVITPASDPGVTLNASTGSVDVAAGTPAGTYTIDYQICENLNPTNCDTATITVVVAPPAINAVDDDYSGTPVNGNTGGNAGNAFSNDTLNGVPIVPAQITATVITAASNPGVTLNTTTGSVDVAAGTPTGTYTIVYEICENLNLTNCDTATITVLTQTPAPLVADPAMSKAGTPSQASVGDTVTFTLTVTNAGNTAAPNVVVIDTLPAMFDVTGVTVNGSFGASINVTPPMGTGPAPYTVQVTLNSPLGVTDVVTVTITTTVNSLGNPPVNNSANVSTSATSDIQSNNADTVTITLRDPSPRSAIANRPAQLPATGFAPDVETKLPAQPHDMLYAATDVLLEIPSLGVKLPIVGVGKKNGTWDVSWLGRQAGWLEGSAFPSWSGNSVLTSHVYDSNGLPGPFVNLYKLKYGDQIIVHAYGQKYIFEVQSNQVVAPNDTSAFKHEEKPWLTLITCKEYDEKTNSYNKRVIVRAVLVKVVWDK
jgi:LPXTG-site transpeptidase (sortase) family protein